MCREVNQATWNSFTPSSKSIGWNWNQSDTIYNFNTLNIDKYISSDLCEAYNRTGKFQRCSQRWPFFRLSCDRQKLLVDSTPVEKFVSQVVTWPAATRVFLLKTKGGREERPWGRGWFSACTNFFFCSLPVQEFFFRVKPSARIFFQANIAFFLSEISIHYLFCA